MEILYKGASRLELLGVPGAQSVEHPILDFGSGLDLMGLWDGAPCQSGSTLTAQSLLFSPSLCPFPAHSLCLSVSLKINTL